MRKPRFALVRHGGYDFDVLFAIGATPQQVLAKLERLGIDDGREEDFEPDFQGRTVMLPCGQTVISLRRFNGSAYDWAVLTHEVWHAVSFLFRRIGITLTRESDEAFGYAIQSLLQNAAEKLRLTK